jgi:ABC-type phosphate transport system substrate-binding protein
MLTLLIGLLMSCLSPPKAICDSPIVFIVNGSNPATSVGVLDLVDYYEKRRRQWPDGETVRFIDRNVGSSERQTFLRDVLKQSESDVDLFWLGQKLHSGNSLPIQVSSDDLVIELVKSFRGAIGYIAASNISSSPKTLEARGVKQIHVNGLDRN